MVSEGLSVRLNNYRKFDYCTVTTLVFLLLIAFEGMKVPVLHLNVPTYKFAWQVKRLQLLAPVVVIIVLRMRLVCQVIERVLIEYACV